MKLTEQDLSWLNGLTSTDLLNVVESGIGINFGTSHPYIKIPDLGLLNQARDEAFELIQNEARELLRKRLEPALKKTDTVLITPPPLKPLA